MFNSQCDGYVKIMRQSQELLESDPDAFLIMSQISFRALRKNSKFNKHNLQVNQALIGDFKTLGLTRQRYRDALERIVKKYKMATIQGTNKGTIATLLNLEFCDINSEHEEPTKEPSKNQQGTTKEECKKEINNNNPFNPPFSENENDKPDQTKPTKKRRLKKTEPVEKLAVRESVLLTEQQLAKLVAEYGQEGCDWMLNKLNNFKLSSGKIYDSDYHAILSWVVGEYEKAKQTKGIGNQSIYEYCMKTKTEWEFENLELEVSREAIAIINKRAVAGAPRVIKFSDHGAKEQIINELKKHKARKVQVELNV